ncbi:hypothetical protein BDV32DRAFT_126002 [Aspergillus pseudonomiae]|nr:hypothetical protein BDV32DRAFT_126002 [Aspergillus pseudonomiae]
MRCLVVDNPFGISAWSATTCHSIFLINRTTLAVCSRIGSDVLNNDTTSRIRDQEILDKCTGTSSHIARRRTDVRMYMPPPCTSIVLVGMSRRQRDCR